MVLPLCNRAMVCRCGAKRRRLSPFPCACSDGGRNLPTLILSNLPVITSSHSCRTAAFQTFRRPRLQAPGLAPRKIIAKSDVIDCVPATAFVAICRSEDIGSHPRVEQYICTPGKVNGLLALQPLNRCTEVVVPAAAAVSQKGAYLADADALMALSWMSTDARISPDASQMVLLRPIPYPILKQFPQHQPTTWPSRAFLSGNGHLQRPDFSNNSSFAPASNATAASTVTTGGLTASPLCSNWCGGTSSASGSASASGSMDVDVVIMKQHTSTGPRSPGSPQQVAQEPSTVPSACQQQPVVPQVSLSPSPALTQSLGAAGPALVTQRGPSQPYSREALQPTQHRLPSNPLEGQAAGGGRLLLRLWPLARPLGPQAQQETIAGQQQQQRQAAGPEAVYTGLQNAGSEILASDSGGAVLKNSRLQSSSSLPPAPTVARLERLLEAAEAAAAAAKACTLSLTHGSIAGTASTDSSKDISGSATPGLPRRVDPQAFFEVDGSLLKGAVLQTACNVIRLAQLGSNLLIVPPWAPAAIRDLTVPAAASLSSPAGTKAGLGSAASAPAGRRRAVALDMVLKLLVDFAGASRALQQAGGQGRELAEGLSALLPLMRRGLSYAEMLMDQVERVLTQEPFVEA